jgi:hypothetical protein
MQASRASGGGSLALRRAAGKPSLVARTAFFLRLVRLVAQKRRNIQVVYVALSTGQILFFQLSKAEFAI